MREALNINEAGRGANPGQWFRRISLPWRIACGLPLLVIAAVVASVVSMQIWISRVQALSEDLQSHSAGAERVASLSVRPSKVLLEPGGGFALVFEPPILAWHTRVLPDLMGITGFMGSTNDVVVGYRNGKVQTIWWGLD
jgi:hypothetical protein